jgi:hypothetical protein
LKQSEKSSGKLKLGKWHHDCIINHKMELTCWSRPLHGCAAIIVKTVVKTVDGFEQHAALGLASTSGAQGTT